jgi:hypothetical protein
MTGLVLNIISFVLGAIGVLLSIYQLNRTLKAERHLVSIIKRDGELLETTGRTSIIRAHELEVYRSKIKELASQLPADEMAAVLEPLDQKSPIGRRNYLKRLLDKANIELTVQA